jgi:alkylated DNA repair dioxygenase AlkB
MAPKMFKAMSKDSEKKVLYSFRTKEESGQMSAWTHVYRCDKTPTNDGCIKIDLLRGGTVKLIMNLVDSECLDRVTTEILESKGIFREYFSSQGGRESRCQFNVHEDSTAGKDVDLNSTGQSQPWYGYGPTGMLQRKLADFPGLAKINELAKHVLDVEKFKIGLNVILYRNGLDSIHKHADNNQNETLIACLTILSPEVKTRKLVISPFGPIKSWKPFDMQVELWMQAGDLYTMDGALQEFHCHYIPKDKKHLDEFRRIALVMRDGEFKTGLTDTGRVVTDLTARMPTKEVFGQMDGLKEGDLLTSRQNMYDVGFHM